MVYFELLKPDKTVNTDRYWQQIINLNHALIEKRLEWAQRHGKVIQQHDNASSDTAKVVKNTLKALNWEVLSHSPYSRDLAPFDYHLFGSMGHSLAEQRFANFEGVEKWLVNGLPWTRKSFFGMVSMIWLKDGTNVYNPMVNTLNKKILRSPWEISVFFIEKTANFN